MISSIHFRKSIFIREFEQFLLGLYSKGLLNGTVHTCVGQEIIPVVISENLTNSDTIFSNHRGHGHFICSGGSPRALLSEMLGLISGASGGIGGSQHLSLDNFFSNGIQGGMAPIAAGYAFANKRAKQIDTFSIENHISVCYIGDGTLGEGALYEALNLSSYFSSPVLFVLENNGYAQSTSFKQVFRGDIRKRVEGFGIRYIKVKVWDYNEFLRATQESIHEARKGRPCFLEIECYRLNSHSKGDDNRSDDEIGYYKSIDLLNQYIKENEFEANEIIANIRAELTDLYNSLDLENKLYNVYRHEFVKNEKVELLDVSNAASDQRINETIYKSLRSKLEEDDNALFIGEDIQSHSDYTKSSYGGAFKVSADLSDIFPNQVCNTPISEAGIVGFGIGTALAGKRTIVEIMFGDFMTLVFDAILQQASKIPEMYSKSLNLPLVIRTPMGARRGYGPTHSQNIEKFFCFLPNINVVAINSEIDLSTFYKSALACNKTTIIIEDKILYTKKSNRSFKYGFRKFLTQEQFPSLIFKSSTLNSNCVIICYGSMLDEVLDSLDKLIEEDIFPVIISLSSLSPINIYPIVSELRNINNLILIEEGSSYASVLGQIVVSLTKEKVPFILRASLSNESIIPCARTAEMNLIPNSKNIVNNILKQWK